MVLKSQTFNLLISRPLIQERAKLFATSLKKEKFKTSNGWLDRFKAGHNIFQAVISRDSGYANHKTVKD